MVSLRKIADRVVRLSWTREGVTLGCEPEGVLGGAVATTGTVSLRAPAHAARSM
jgi:hypothetical protein